LIFIYCKWNSLQRNQHIFKTAVATRLVWVQFHVNLNTKFVSIDQYRSFSKAWDAWWKLKYIQAYELIYMCDIICVALADSYEFFKTLGVWTWISSLKVAIHSKLPMFSLMKSDGKMNAFQLKHGALTHLLITWPNDGMKERYLRHLN